MMWRTFVVVLCIGLVWGWFLPKAEAADRGKRSRSSHKSLPASAPDTNIGKEGSGAAPEQSSRTIQRATPVSGDGVESRDPVAQAPAPAVRPSREAATQLQEDPKDGSVRSAKVGDAVPAALPGPSGYPDEIGAAATGTEGRPDTPSLGDRSHLSALPAPEDPPKSARTSPNGLAASPNYLEIEVSHSAHIFRLYAHTPSGGNREALYECKVGLGGPGFPTPVGVYYVTHIYDDDPWWIPPKDRAWAAGDSPSRRVYGGTMAPLLKKRDVRAKNEPTYPEEKISGPVKLEDHGYRFHGTNSPRSIGHNQSHGCVRMLPDDARKVANLIKERVGIAERKQSENGNYVVLVSPVKLNLVK